MYITYLFQKQEPIKPTVEQLVKMEEMKQKELKKLMKEKVQEQIHQYVRDRIVSHPSKFQN